MRNSKIKHTLFGGNIATEIEQAYVRIGIFFVASVYFIWVDKQYVLNNNELMLVIYLSVSYSVGITTLLTITYFPQRVVRQKISSYLRWGGDNGCFFNSW